MTHFLENLVRRGAGLSLPALEPAASPGDPWRDRDVVVGGDDARELSAAGAPPLRESPVQRAPVDPPGPPATLASFDPPRARDRTSVIGPPSSMQAIAREVAAPEPAASPEAFGRADASCLCEQAPAADEPPALHPVDTRAPGVERVRVEPLPLVPRPEPVPTSEERDVPVEVTIGTIEVQLTSPAVAAKPAVARPARPPSGGFDGYAALRTYRRRV